MHAMTQPVPAQIFPLKNRILHAGRKILSASDRTPSNSYFHQARYELYEIAAEAHNPIIIDAITSDPDIQELSRTLFPLSCEAGIYEECAIARELLADPDLTFETVYDRYYGATYEALMQDELEWLQDRAMFDMAGQTIAYVGGGAMPLPALLLARRFGCRITIVDPDETSVALARELVARVGLAHLIDAVIAGGQDFDYTDYTMAWMANWIGQKGDIFVHLQRHKRLHHVVARSAAEDTLSFIINDSINLCTICNNRFNLAYKVPRRTGLSLMSLIFRNNPAE